MQEKKYIFTCQTFLGSLVEDGNYVAKPLPKKKSQERTSTSRESFKASSQFLVPFYFSDCCISLFS